MIDFKEFKNQAIETATSPTAFTWYAIAGVIATGITTFLATYKWAKEIDTIDDTNPFKKWWHAPFKRKVTDAARTALIFAGPVVLGIGTCYCIKHSHDLSMTDISNAEETISSLMKANNFLIDKANGVGATAAGVALSKMDSKTDIYAVNSGKYSFSDDPEGELEDYGKPVLFCDEFCWDDGPQWFESTIFDVMMAEQELQKLISIRGYATLWEFHSFLGLKLDEEEDKWKNFCGWDNELAFKRGQYQWVEFAHHRDISSDGRPYYAIRYVSSPGFAEEFEWIYNDS